MEKPETTPNVAGTDALTLEHWVRTQTLPFFWKALARELDAGKTYDACVRHLQGYFKAGNGAPTGRQLREIVNRMVQRKEAPSDFLSAWDRRRGRHVEETVETGTRVPDDSFEDQPPPTAPAIVVAPIAGLDLELVATDWVTLRSLFDPFGKRVAHQLERLKEWAHLRKFQVAARRPAEDRPGNLPPSETWAIHRDHVLQAIGELDTRGMDEHTKAGLVRFKRECAEALNAYFFGTRKTEQRLIALETSTEAALMKLLEKVVSSARATDTLATAVEGVSVGMTALSARVSHLEAATKTTEQERRRAGIDPAPDGWLPHRLVAASHGLPSFGPHGRIAAFICGAVAFTEDPELVRVAPHGRFKRPTHMLSPECVRRLEPALDAARQTMRDYGYQVSRANALEPRREVRPLFTATRVVDEMVEAAQARLLLAAA